jgi:mono/diheme cytochrome c family protein
MKKKMVLPVSILLSLILLVTACGGVTEVERVEPTARPYTPQTGAESDPEEVVLVGNPVDGFVVFEQYCLVCHLVDADEDIGGPSLLNAGLRMEYDYVKESILYPEEHDAWVERELDAVDVDMPTDFGGLLTPQQLEDLIAYVLSLK